MHTNKKRVAGSPAAKKAPKPAAPPAQPVTLAPAPTAPVAAVTYWIRTVAAPLPLASTPPAALAPATPEAKPSCVPLTPMLLSVPAPTVTPAAPSFISAERGKLIEFESYLLAEKHHFQGDPADYWRRAEAIVASNAGQNDGPAGQAGHGPSSGHWEGRLA